MKTKYFDMKNVYELLPVAGIGQKIKTVEEYAKKDKKVIALFDHLINHNKQTLNKNLPDLKRFIQGFVQVIVGGGKCRVINYADRPRYMPHLGIFHHFNAGVEPILSFCLASLNKLTHEMSIYEVQLQLLLKGWGPLHKHHCYTHAVNFNRDNFTTDEWFNNRQKEEALSENNKHYGGITSRHWLKRWKEHASDAKSGRSNKLFHTELRNSEQANAKTIHHRLVHTTETLDEAMNWEEEWVRRNSLYPKGLNMIEGGYAGLKFLHEHRITDRVNISLDEREDAIERYVERQARSGYDNPAIAEMWKSYDYYLKHIQARPDTLEPEQVRLIRLMSMEGASIEKITEYVGARNTAQVRRVINNKTYTRIS